MHYVRWKKYGDPMVSYADRKKIAWVETNASYGGDDCLKWPFSVNGNGRGDVSFNGVKHRSAPKAMCWLAHGPPPSEEYEAAHSCGKGHEGCMNPRHLSWKTRKENETDKIDHGTARRGCKINTTKLTENDVREIRDIVGTVKVGVITKRFGISRGQVYKIRDRHAWAWLDEEKPDVV